jgi:hypothetical protein
MTRRALLVGLVGLALAAWSAGPVTAEDKPGTHEGTVVKVEEGKLTMTGKDGKDEHTHVVSRDAKISCDGKECKLEDLLKGYTVRVTTEKKGDETVVTKVEAKKAA